MRRAGALKSGDDDRGFDLDIVDLGVARQQVLDLQAILGERQQEREVADPTERGQPPFAFHTLEKGRHRAAKFVVAEVVETGLFRGCAE